MVKTWRGFGVKIFLEFRCTEGHFSKSLFMLKIRFIECYMWSILKDTCTICTWNIKGTQKGLISWNNPNVFTCQIIIIIIYIFYICSLLLLKEQSMIFRIVRTHGEWMEFPLKSFSNAVHINLKMLKSSLSDCVDWQICLVPPYLFYLDEVSLWKWEKSGKSYHF